jgi:ribosomal-protein-alanine N-acetyltransferase
MELRSERIVLRTISPGDQEHVFRGLSHPDVVRYYGVRFDSPEATQEQMAWYARLVREGTGHWWAIRSAENDSFLGAVGLNNIVAVHRRCELGFWLLPEHWNKGYVSDALPLVIAHAFSDLGLHRIMAEVEVANTASARVLERAGFVHEGTLRECEMKDGRYLSLAIYALLNTP